jgi:sugar phosphate isomerase/epimerase
MKIICNLSGITDYNRPVQGISDIKKSGFEEVFIDLRYIYKEGMEENLNDFIDACSLIINKCKEAKAHIYAVRSPYFPEDNKETALCAVQQKLVEETIKICNEAGCKNVIVPPISSQLNSNDTWEVNLEYYSKLAKIAGENNVTILLENQYRNFNGHKIRGMFSNEKETCQWIDRLNEIAGEERFGVCMNTGTFNICGQDMQNYAHFLGNRVKAVILRDSYANHDVSMVPFTAVIQGQSQTDWLSLIRGLREIGFDGGLILDVADTASAFSPILRPQLLYLAKAVAEYFSWQINIENQLKKYKAIVLFGAGNMCRNYMKCYGEKYPPIFTCDNNPKLWGSDFYGLEVKSPEALKEIPSDWGIFICNIYYREIEQQLKDMGIKNNIDFFNDEYMPSFYFDRLERM